MGVAACWHGGTRGLRETLVRQSAGRTGDLAALHVGVVDAELHASEAVLAGGTAGQILGLRVRAVVASAAERTIRQVGHALGPVPLAFDDDHARRVADLELYVRQHHAERDLARLGSAVLAGRPDWDSG
jgi:hypothetical protein